MNEQLRALQPYHTVRLDALKSKIRSRGGKVFDFGTGDPNEPTPEVIRKALIDAVPEVPQYAAAKGGDALRQVASEYVARRYGVTVDPETEVLSTSGSMEAIFHMPMILIDEGSDKNLVVYGEPAYSVFKISALYAGAEPHGYPLTAEDHYLLTPEMVGAETLAKTALVFLNYPHNPSGQVMPPELFKRWVEAREEHGFVLVSDECYNDIYYEEPPHTLLEFGRKGCLAIHSLSKRSGMTGYQSGFMCGDAEIMATLARFRVPMGLATPTFVQAAAMAAWQDTAHVEERRAIFGEKRKLLIDLLVSRGLKPYPGTAGILLWAEVPEGTTDIDYAEKLLEHGIVVSPGSFYGPTQDRFIRMAVVPTLEDIHECAKIWPN